MKLKIEIDLNNFYAENFEGDPDCGISPTASLSQEVVDVIKYEDKAAISKCVAEDVKKKAQEAYGEFGESKIKSIVDYEMNKFISEGKIKESYGSKMIPVADKLREIFDSHSSWGNTNKQMEKMGEKFSKECRDRYDMLFASNVVRGLEKQGLLKEGVIKSLMNDSSDK